MKRLTIVVGISFLTILSSCSTNESEINKSCVEHFKNFYYVSNQKTSKGGVFLNFIKINYGQTFKDSSFIQIATYEGLENQGCFRYKMYFENSVTLKLIKKEEIICTFSISKLNEYICKNEQLVFLIENKCNRQIKKYILKRKKGVQKFPKLH